MRFHVIIPARLQSTRLPNKPLADLHGIPMVVRVAQRASQSDAASVTVAADDLAIVEACKAFNIPALLTNKNHPSGSDRLAEAAQLLDLSHDEIVVNVQGDEPLIPISLINACAQTLHQQPECAISTAAHEIDSAEDYTNPNVVKVVCNGQSQALYFSRAPIPWWRDGNLQQAENQTPQPPSLHHAGITALRHIGIYAYRVQFLLRFPQLAVSPIEQCESLEQLRAMWHGERIAVHLTEERPGPGVDTPNDLERVRGLLA